MLLHLTSILAWRMWFWKTKRKSRLGLIHDTGEGSIEAEQPRTHTHYLLIETSNEYHPLINPILASPNPFFSLSLSLSSSLSLRHIHAPHSKNALYFIYSFTHPTAESQISCHISSLLPYIPTPQHFVFFLLSALLYVQYPFPDH